jgi:hypothetical protein
MLQPAFYAHLVETMLLTTRHYNERVTRVILICADAAIDAVFKQFG